MTTEGQHFVCIQSRIFGTSFKIKSFSMLTSQKIKEGIEEMKTNAGRTVAEISDNQPAMIIFLRHFGCTFCREALAEISHKRKEITDILLKCHKNKFL